MKSVRNKFYCFSPPVMIATFFIEIFYIVYLLATRKLGTLLTVAIILLLCLATFQLAEYGICEYWGLDGATWAKIGFSAITFLPPLGLHMVYLLANKKPRILVPIAYILALTWVALFQFADVLNGSVCSGNYVIFHIPDGFELPYYLYYDSLMFIAVCLAFIFASKANNNKQRVALQAMAIGYLSFIIPSIFFSMFDNHGGADSNLPSVMCGFAVLFATVITFKVVPNSVKKK